MRSLCIATREYSHSPQQEKACMSSSEDPAAKKKSRQGPHSYRTHSPEQRTEDKQTQEQIYIQVQTIKKYDAGNLSEFQHKTEEKGEGSHVKKGSKNIPEHPSNEDWINNT